ncbi:MAG TPA: peptidoglycan DD-metalloendopeptidase family protein [Candidatus Limnocylindrales bacterium]|jgi:murein DD-endopeptidase MepM/ murein hydrolase activator NlpD
MTKNLRVKLAWAVALALTMAIVLPTVASAVWPVHNPRNYISQGYSSRHRGVDIASRRWSPVVPMRTGKVVFAGWRSNCGGYQVWISHGRGVYSAYYHLAREVTFPGDQVVAGTDTIGYVGTTGCVTGSHVHVELWRGFPWRYGSYRVNPLTYITEGGAYLPAKYR